MAKSTYYCHASGTGESPKKKKDEERDNCSAFLVKKCNGYRRIRAALERPGWRLCW